MKKTLKQWEKSDIDLDKFLTESPCEIDEDLYNYIASTIPAQYMFAWLVQWLEANRENNWVLEYSTVYFVWHKYYYLWILPEFIQL